MKCEFVEARVRSVGCAVAGVAHVVRTQRNAWIHAAATAGVAGMGFCQGVSAGQWCWLIAAVAAVWVAEAMNTAVELLADAACPEWDPQVGRAKDVAAGAVLLAAVAAAGIGVCVLGGFGR